ncbi:unnamed protein product [Eruca vesicaria subsp. sativa]|uniref:Transcription initiation factor IIB n=1 Tax=Eruca vesicaria subsp. sativa TaxID=29727 RepID=A0ABC8J6B9_ERUVS|nr:unnamed protein product [Eruca vesicaria subsp. sativa]
MQCNKCNGSNFQREEYTGNSSQLGGIGTTGTGSFIAYKEKKIFDANNLIENITQRLQLSYKDEEINRMINKITNGEFGQGAWFLVLISACCYVVVRREGKDLLSMEKIREEFGVDLHQLGNMVKRVVDYLGVELQEFDLVGLFVKTVNDSSRLSGVGVKKKEKWFLFAGRRPMPLVVAVLAFVCGVNGVNVKVEDLAKDCKVWLVTCKARYKELSEKLLKVAEEVGLPWARDVTVKNVVRYSVVLFGLMEAKSMRKRRDELVRRSDGICLKEIVRDFV